MLPRPVRLRDSEEFRRATRRGVRAGRTTLVVHVVAQEAPGVRVGFVVSKAVGNAVTRNRVKRRLRHLAHPWLSATPDRTAVVVRALPPAAAAGGDLGRDLDAAWSRAVAKLPRVAPGRGAADEAR